MNWFEYFKKENAIGEVLRSSHSKFTIQTYSSIEVPKYASIVVSVSGDSLVTGVITAVSIEPKEIYSQSIPSPLKRTREELLKGDEYKDIIDKLTTLCECVIIGYYKDLKFEQSRPKNIPWIHDLVFIPPKDFIREMHLANEKYKKIYNLNSNFILNYIPLIYNSLPLEEQRVFYYFLKTFIDNLAENFNKEELLEILKSIQKSIAENNLEQFISLISVNKIIAEIIESKY